METEIINFVEVFNSKRRYNLWNVHQERMKLNFKAALRQLHTLIQHPNELCENQINGWEKNTCGYRGVGFNSGYSSGIRTKDSIGLPSFLTTNDHVIGTSECGRIVHKEFIRCNFDYDYMVNQWLYNHLYLWATIKVTKEEHRKDNIHRDKNTLDEKLNLQHYINISELIYD